MKVYRTRNMLLTFREKNLNGSCNNEHTLPSEDIHHCSFCTSYYHSYSPNIYTLSSILLILWYYFMDLQTSYPWTYHVTINVTII